MPRVVHFEVSADDLDRARKFYGDVFGWSFQDWNGGEYVLVKTGEDGEPGINGGIFKRPDQMTGHINTIDVPSLDEYTEKVTGSGGTLMMPKMAIPGVGWLAYFKDTEGSMFGLMEKDSSAA
jgi:predicted enzyme related to lactoylglutathione lyase